ncbi:DUF4178 domain-containing protein [Jannaschia ovalis]|uniref:DUF4178 domain-containing protein n=1 Tax=Jannaschia ovalis TaxID=3038773 RepID=A0ABY8LCQ3_9RHOB|nr:DUF4178 domain-containing protein [Jannaschia sp. GRR-S6-38]WGH79106.1 DUF4178 domain-containing protein [Jannaschia sp. GRR-S6-38]
MTDAARAIDCPNCGAGLPVLGGGRVVMQVCSYCGAALDALDDWRVMKVFGDMPRPESPFRLGMEGRIEGVPFTIIGTLGQSETYEGRTWRWTDHMLFSPTHGYAWLTVEDGHTLLTRKQRDWPGGGFLTSAVVERSEQRPSRAWRGRTYRYYATSNWRTDFVEGAFNWRPAKDARGTTVSMMPNGRALDMLAFVEGRAGQGVEREVERTTYWPEAAAAFGATPPVPQGTHPLQPWKAEQHRGYYLALFGGLTAAALVAVLAMLSMRGEGRLVWDAPPRELSAPLAIEITNADRPVMLRLDQRLRNDWAVYGIALTGPDGAPLADTERAISYYSGTEGGESWTEGSRSVTLGFQPPAPGRYELALSQLEAGSRDAGRVPLRVTAHEGRTNITWLTVALAGFALALAWVASAPYRHRMARWKGGDWSDD